MLAVNVPKIRPVFPSRIPRVGLSCFHPNNRSSVYSEAPVGLRTSQLTAISQSYLASHYSTATSDNTVYRVVVGATPPAARRPLREGRTAVPTAAASARIASVTRFGEGRGVEGGICVGRRGKGWDKGRVP